MRSQSSGDIRRPRIPHVYVLLFGLLVLTAILSVFVSPGTYLRDAGGRVVPDTFVYDSDEADVGLIFAVFQAPLRGIQDAAGIIAFILVVGGAFKVLEETRAFVTALRGSVRYLGQAEFFVIPVSILLFSIGGAVVGMGEEIIPFVLIFLPIARVLGLHPVVGVAVPLIGSQVGFAGAMFNPSSVGAAQGLAGLPPFAGWGPRTVLWLAMTLLAIVFVTRQARRWGYDTETLDPDMVFSPTAKVTFTGAQVRVLLAFAVGFVLLAWGARQYAWSVTEMGAVFLAMGIVAGVLGGFSANRIARCFATGARELLSAALVVGVARGIVVLARDTHILDSVLHGVAGGLEGLPGVVALHLMFLFHSLLNFFVPSGTGQAALTMPILAPLADQLGLTRQMAVLAFQMGDGFSNMIVPTSAVLMGSLEAGQVSYERWFRFAWKLQLWLLIFALVTLSIAYVSGFGP